MKMITKEIFNNDMIDTLGLYNEENFCTFDP